MLDIKVIKVRNKPKTTKVNGQFVTLEPVQFNPNRIEFTFEEHIGSDLANTNLFKDNGISGKALMQVQSAIKKANPEYKDNLQIVDEDTFYTVQTSVPKDSTKPMRYRHWTTKSNVNLTSVTVAYREPDIAVSVSL